MLPSSPPLPAIAARAQALGVEPGRTLNAEESVARGAALAAALQSPNFKMRPLLLQEGLLQPLTVRWHADDGGPPSGSLTLERGAPLPLTRRLTLRTDSAVRVSCQQDGCGGQQLEQVAPAAAPRSRWAAWKGKGGTPTRAMRVDVTVDANQLPSVSAVELADAEEGAEEGVEEGAEEGAVGAAEEGAAEGAEEGAAEGAEEAAEPPAAKTSREDEAASPRPEAGTGEAEHAVGADAAPPAPGTAAPSTDDGTADTSQQTADPAIDEVTAGEANSGDPMGSSVPPAPMPPAATALPLDEVSSFGLPANSIEALRAEEEELRRVDAQVEARLHAKNELEACVYRTRSAAAEHVESGLLAEEEGAAMRARLAVLEDWLDVQRLGLRSWQSTHACVHIGQRSPVQPRVPLAPRPHRQIKSGLAPPARHVGCCGRPC